ncbi:hypothetical protein [Pseudoramibacter alactolyticus]|uniref:hypothetical protein n=1 Tax=Pseudoramibacter alactolyticus TaxID=113287 RepID=UPI00248DE3E0|nr:hypothetical protein [Pseudoramibacter alactolyticus]
MGAMRAASHFDGKFQKAFAKLPPLYYNIKRTLLCRLAPGAGEWPECLLIFPLSAGKKVKNFEEDMR